MCGLKEDFWSQKFKKKKKKKKKRISINVIAKKFWSLTYSFNSVDLKIETWSFFPSVYLLISSYIQINFLPGENAEPYCGILCSFEFEWRLINTIIHLLKKKQALSYHLQLN